MVLITIMFWRYRSVAEVVDVGPLADWVKINVKETVSNFCQLLRKREKIANWMFVLI